MTTRGRTLGWLLTAATVVWPLLLAAALRQQIHTPTVWSTAAYLGAGRVCHQIDARSFHTHATKWPVCGRCSGLYLAAPMGALLAVSGRRRHRLDVLALAAVPTALTLVVEWGGLAPVSNLARALSAVPLGIAIAFTLVALVNEPPRSISYTDGR